MILFSFEELLINPLLIESIRLMDTKIIIICNETYTIKCKSKEEAKELFANIKESLSNI